MRSLFDRQLKELNDSLVFMGVQCEDCITFAMQSLLLGTKETAQKALSLERDIDEKEREIQSLCMRMLLQQQPVAGDLRMISAALKMITDMERIGDQAADIADIGIRTDLAEAPGNMHISAMGDGVIRMISDAVTSFVKKDKALAESVIAQDDAVDALFCTVKEEIVAMICSGREHSEDVAGQALELMMTAKYLERMGDHIVNIAESVCSMMPGKQKNNIVRCAGEKVE